MGAALKDDLPRGKLDQRAEGLDQSPGFAGESGKQAVAGEGRVGFDQFI
jgi:hypothetical protein